MVEVHGGFKQNMYKRILQSNLLVMSTFKVLATQDRRTEEWRGQYIDPGQV